MTEPNDSNAKNAATASGDAVNAVTFDRAQCEMLEAMGLGPVWLLRETPDPFLPELAPGLQRAPTGAAPRRAPAPERPAAPAATSAPLAASPRPRAAAPVPAPAVASLGMPDELAQKILTADWETLEKMAEDCRCCAMASTRQHVVFAQGAPGPKLVVVGEAPGAEEDLQGLPFVGKSGQLLTAMLDALNIVRGRDAVVLNVLKCRPPRNRNPEPAEITCCGHWLKRQLELLAPDVLFLVGRFAIEALLHPGEGFSIGRMRGRVHDAEVAGRRIPAVATYHPSYLLRSPDEKAKAWEDLVLLRHVMTEAGIAPAPRAKRWN